MSHFRKTLADTKIESSKFGNFEKKLFNIKFKYIVLNK